jgi:hypothetical protein
VATKAIDIAANFCGICTMKVSFKKGISFGRALLNESLKILKQKWWNPR